MRRHKKLKAAVTRAVVQAMVVSPVILVLWNASVAKTIENAGPLSWPSAFSLCLLVRILSAGDLVPLFLAEDHGRERRKTTGKTRKQNQGTNRRQRKAG